MKWWLWIQVVLLGISAYTFIGVVVAKMQFHFWPKYDTIFGAKKIANRADSEMIGIGWPIALPIMIGILLARKLSVFEEKE